LDCGGDDRLSWSLTAEMPGTPLADLCVQPEPPGLFGAADLHRRLWYYALAYTIRQIIFWPPDRAETDDLEVTHPLHALRRLIDAPLPLPAAGD
jgi:hypothetical protein